MLFAPNPFAGGLLAGMVILPLAVGLFEPRLEQIWPTLLPSPFRKGLVEESPQMK